jgi:hypothetical protein
MNNFNFVTAVPTTAVPATAEMKRRNINEPLLEHNVHPNAMTINNSLMSNLESTDPIDYVTNQV